MYLTILADVVHQVEAELTDDDDSSISDTNAAANGASEDEVDVTDVKKENGGGHTGTLNSDSSSDVDSSEDDQDDDDDVHDENNDVTVDSVSDDEAAVKLAKSLQDKITDQPQVPTITCGTLLISRLPDDGLICISCHKCCLPALDFSPADHLCCSALSYY